MWSPDVFLSDQLVNPRLVKGISVRSRSLLTALSLSLFLARRDEAQDCGGGGVDERNLAHTDYTHCRLVMHRGAHQLVELVAIPKKNGPSIS